jgi:hypothetical protein
MGSAGGYIAEDIISEVDSLATVYRCFLLKHKSIHVSLITRETDKKTAFP